MHPRKNLEFYLQQETGAECGEKHKSQYEGFAKVHGTCQDIVNDLDSQAPVELVSQSRIGAIKKILTIWTLPSAHPQHSVTRR